MEQLTIQEKRGANYVLFELSGAINSYNYTEFQAKVYAGIRETNVVLDLSNVTGIDSSGLGVIMGAYNDGEISGHKIYLKSMSPMAQKAVASTGFLDTFDVIYSVTEVL